MTGTLGNSPNPDTVTRLRARTSGIPYEDKIINSLLQMKNRGLYDNTLRTTSQKLNQLSKHSDLMKPLEVLTYIANLSVTNSTRQKLANCYEYFCQVNRIEFQKPKYKCEETVPIIPTTENVTKIISASSRRFATIFTIMAETAVEGEELHQTRRSQIDLEQGIISIKGKNVDDLDLEKLGKLIQQANQKASKVSLKGLLKNLKRSDVNNSQGG